MSALEDLAKRVAARASRRVRDRIQELYLRGMGIAGAAGVTAPVRFALNELFLVRGAKRYTLRRSGRTLVLRHPMSDGLAVFEVISRRTYRPPVPVERLLAEIPAPRMVDLGAHIGTATLALLERYPAARILALEPNPETAALLRRNVEVNGIGDSCVVLQAAAGVEPGTATMQGESFLAHFVRSGTEEATSLVPALGKYLHEGEQTEVEVVDVLPLLEGADLVKMDIEGAEWPILQDPRFATLGISALVLEYHPQGAPQADTFAAVSALLGDAGFAVEAPVAEYGSSVGVAWAWRP